MISFIYNTKIKIGVLNVQRCKRYLEVKSQYFFLHFLFNIGLCYLVYNETLFCLLNPLKIFEEDYSQVAIKSTIVISSFHVYHIIDKYTILTKEDWIHYIVSSIMIPIIGLCNPFGKIISFSNFVMCGLPGGIDYLLLVLVKYNYLNRLTEKSINRWLNLLIRMHIQMLSCYLIFLNIYHNNLIYNKYIIFGTILHTINSIYYCNKVVGNYHVMHYKSK